MVESLRIYIFIVLFLKFLYEKSLFAFSLTDLGVQCYGFLYHYVKIIYKQRNTKNEVWNWNAFATKHCK